LTWKDLADIINRYKEKTNNYIKYNDYMILSKGVTQQELDAVNALDARLKREHDNAKKVGDTKSPSFWLYLFWEDMFMTDEEKYQDLRDNNGFGHEGIDGGADTLLRDCKYECRFYAPTGKVDATELLQVKYSHFDGFEEVLAAWDLIKKEGKN
jgi:hypothetical protein